MTAFEEQWAHLPAYLGGHLRLTFAALIAGVAFSVPLGLLVARVNVLRAPVLGAVAAIQTVPGLALLAFMVLVFGFIGFLPAILALTLYSMLPIVRNTVTGLNGADLRVVEAARGMGMTSTQILLKVQLPLAVPVIVAGIRTAAVWTVGLATLATPVGAVSLGNYIFSGLQTMNQSALLMGTAAAAALALALDGIIGLLEFAANRGAWKPATAALAVAIALGAALLYPRGGNDTINIGAKPFTEQYILARVIERRLEESGVDVTTRENLGSTVAFEALAGNTIDCYVDYTSTIWFNYMKRTDNPGRDAILAQTKEWLSEERGVTLLGALGFENAYAFAMRDEHAAELGIERVSDLVAVAPKLRLGSDYEFFERPEWRNVRDTYGLRFEALQSFDPTLMYPAVAAEQVDVITAFTTDGRILEYNLRILDDDKGAFPPYDAVLLLSPAAAQDRQFVDALTPLVDAIDNETMRGANKRVDVDGATVSETAADIAVTD